MNVGALSRARRIQVIVPPPPSIRRRRHGRRAVPAELISPAYPADAVQEDFFSVQLAKRAWQSGVTSTTVHQVAECVFVAERLFGERSRLLALLVSERVGRPAATVRSVLAEVGRRMDEFAGTGEYECTDPVQALAMVAGGMLEELDAPNQVAEGGLIL